MSNYTWDYFRKTGIDIVSRSSNGFNSDKVTMNQDRIFRSQFGVSCEVCEILWLLLKDHGKFNKTRKPEHLLWALLFLTVYGKETTHASMCKTTEKTYRKWIWRVLEEIADLVLIKVSFHVFFSVKFNLKFKKTNSRSFFLTDTMGEASRK
jgi:hypothetical protein